MERTPRLTWEDLDRLAITWAGRFCASPAYWRLHGRPVCSILNLTDFVHHYGLLPFTALLQRLSQVMRAWLGVAPYLIGVVSQTNRRNLQLANRLPIDAVTGYALLPNWQADPIQHYEDLIGQRVREWYAFQARLRIPFLPVASAGWDASVRGERVPALAAHNRFPWAPVVIGVTPQRFGHFLDEAITFNERRHPGTNIVFIHAWNEWTESSVIEPGTRFGLGFLEEIWQRRQQLAPASFGEIGGELSIRGWR